MEMVLLLLEQTIVFSYLIFSNVEWGGAVVKSGILQYCVWKNLRTLMLWFSRGEKKLLYIVCVYHKFTQRSLFGSLTLL